MLSPKEIQLQLTSLESVVFPQDENGLIVLGGAPDYQADEQEMTLPVAQHRLHDLQHALPRCPQCQRKVRSLLVLGSGGRQDLLAIGQGLSFDALLLRGLSGLENRAFAV